MTTTTTIMSSITTTLVDRHGKFEPLNISAFGNIGAQQKKKIGYDDSMLSAVIRFHLLFSISAILVRRTSLQTKAVFAYISASLDTRYLGKTFREDTPERRYRRAGASGLEKCDDT